MRNPSWSRDELILALELYFKIDYGQMNGTNIKVKNLSNLLTLMNLHNGFSRSVNSVALKLANFKVNDPNYKGKGMKGVGKLEENIYKEFSQNKDLLYKTSNKIKQEVIHQRKVSFINWLKINGKPNGIPYKEKTILIYASQVEKNILKEFSINTEGLTLYELIDLYELKKIENILYTGIDNKKRRDLRSAFQCYLRYVQNNSMYDENIILKEEESYTEGGKKVYISKKAERNIKLREKAISIHGTTCKVCAFNFEEIYGIWGKGFIEVHHLIPLGTGDNQIRITDPKKDLIVLCANCHRMVHRKKGITLTVEELKQKLKTQS